MNSSVSSPLDTKHAFLEPTFPVVPTKRKRSNTSTNHGRIETSTNTTTQRTGKDSTAMKEGADTIYCICGFSHDDGFSIACDNCERWSHGQCFDIGPTAIPEHWLCWQCSPRVVDRDRAIRLQKVWLRNQAAGLNGQLQALLGMSLAVDGAHHVGGVVGPGKRRRERRTSISTAHVHTTGATNVATPGLKTPVAEDEPVDIEEEIKRSYVPISEDSIPHKSTRDAIRTYAPWRGVMALEEVQQDQQSVGEMATATKVVHIPGDPGDVSAKVRPPTFALQTTRPIRETAYIMPYTSVVIPSAMYLADPLNLYAHMSMCFVFKFFVICSRSRRFADALCSSHPSSFVPRARCSSGGQRSPVRA